MSIDEPENKASLRINADLLHEFEVIHLDNQAITDENESEVCNIGNMEQKLLHTAKILLVEDNLIAQTAAKSLLKDLHCEVVIADTGEMALELYKKYEYDLIFMDIGLPGKDGCQIAKEIRVLEKQQGKHTPIIALTAHIDEDNKQQCLNAGIEKVLTKPLKEDVANQILNTYVYAADTRESNSEINSGSLQIIDIALGAKLVGGSEKMAKDMLAMFVVTLAEAENSIKAAYEIKDLEKIHFTVHKLLGGACYCGVPRLKSAAKYLEDILKFKNIADFECAYAILCDEISNVLEEYKKNTIAPFDKVKYKIS